VYSSSGGHDKAPGISCRFNVILVMPTKTGFCASAACTPLLKHMSDRRYQQCYPARGGLAWGQMWGIILSHRFTPAPISNLQLRITV